ncbi:unnamed protein product [Soboliphyme baturini]|uniref:CACTA en-spm transposon protein n=1 Tax=Soboliphyme baturini TaxID=241478 RepID=A0A183J4C3_9BILA|nr:unnamed protein product [Soboliphyme baturini]
MFRARIHIIPAVERRALYESHQGTGSTEMDEPEMERQVGTTDLTMTASIEQKYQNFTEKHLRCSKRPEHARLNSTVSEVTEELLEKRRTLKRDKINNVE